MNFFLVALVMAAPASAATLRSMIGHRNLTLTLTHTLETPPLPVPAPRMSLVFAGFGCKPIGQVTAQTPFALYTWRGECTFDTKMQIAYNAHASVLIVADTLATQYDHNASAGKQEPSTMELRNPCLVDCAAGRGVVDTSVLNVNAVLSGLPGSCPDTDGAPRHADGCMSHLCAFAGTAPNASAAASGATKRDVCCALDTAPIQMAFGNSTAEGGGSGGGAPLPALYLTLSRGVLLERACGAYDGADLLGGGGGGGGGTHVSACMLRLEEEAREAHGRWDGSAFLIWAVGVGTAALASYLGALEHHAQDVEVSAASADLHMRAR